jgi:superfamily I DNA/RNA helicase
VSDVKDVDDSNGNVVKPQAVSLITLHSGKGLEFDCVFSAGMEYGLVPMILNG